MSGRKRRTGLLPLDEWTHHFPYARVSKEEQAREGVSIPNQLAAIGLHIERQPKAIAARDYVDIESGRKTSRINYQRLLLDIRAAIAEQKRVVLVVWRVDRLGRDLAESIRVWDELWRLGVEIHSVTEGGLLTPTHYRLFAWMAQEESDRISARVTGAWEHFERNRWHKPGAPAWGYDLRPATGEERANGSPNSVLIPHAIEAPYVRELFERYAAGASVRKLAMWAAGLPAAARGAREADGTQTAREPRNLGFNAIRQRLRAPVYISRLGEYDDTAPMAILDAPRGRWEPLVSDELWAACVRARETAVRVPRQASGAYRLTGLLHCDRCGSRMSGRRKCAQPGQNKPARFEYICNAGLTLGASTDGRRCLATVAATALEEQTIALVGQVLAGASQADGRADLATAWDRLVRDERIDSATGRIRHLEHTYEELSREMTGALRRLNRDQLSRAEYDELRAVFEAERTDVEAELVRLRGMVKPKPAPMELAPLLASLGAWERGLRSENVGLVRDALAVLLERIVPVRIRRGEYGVDLAWTPVGLWLLTVAAARSNDADLVRVDHLARARWSTQTFTGVA